MRWNRSILAGYLFILLVLFAHLSSCDWPVHFRCKSFIVEIESLHRCIQIYIYTYYIYMYTGWWFETVFIFPSYWECHHPNWLTPSFFRGVGQPPTSIDIYIVDQSPSIIRMEYLCHQTWRIAHLFDDIKALLWSSATKMKGPKDQQLGWCNVWPKQSYLFFFFKIINASDSSIFIADLLVTLPLGNWTQQRNFNTHTRIYIYICIYIYMYTYTYLEQNFQLLTMSDFQLPYVL